MSWEHADCSLDVVDIWLQALPEVLVARLELVSFACAGELVRAMPQIILGGDTLCTDAVRAAAPFSISRPPVNVRFVSGMRKYHAQAVATRIAQMSS